MKFIRDIRDDPAPPTDWRALITRYPATFWLLIAAGGQSFGRLMLGNADQVKGAIGLMVILAAVGLPVAQAIDRWRLWRSRRASAAQRVPEAERLYFRP